jgi:methionyl-tRNA synthetase
MSTELPIAGTPPSESPATPPAPTTPLISIDDFMRIDLRVGQIVSAERVPKSKKLLKLEVSLGESLGNRQILAGIGTHYEPDVLVGRRVAIVANLTPAKLMGLESQGMLLAGSSEDDSVLAVLEPDCHLPLGARIR